MIITRQPYIELKAEQYAEDDVNLAGKLEDCEAHIEKCSADEIKRRKVDRILASIVFLFNVAMLIGNLTASILSGESNRKVQPNNTANSLNPPRFLLCPLGLYRQFYGYHVEVFLALAASRSS